MTLLITAFAAVIATIEFFTPASADMINDSYLGLSVVALGLIIWIVVLLVKDPDGKVRAALSRK